MSQKNGKIMPYQREMLKAILSGKGLTIYYKSRSMERSYINGLTDRLISSIKGFNKKLKEASMKNVKVKTQYTLEKVKADNSIIHRHEKVRIYSKEHMRYWKELGHGYTLCEDEAGIYPFEDAFNLTRDLDPEKGIIFIAIIDMDSKQVEIDRQKEIIKKDNKEYLFRGKRIDNGELIEGCLLQAKDDEGKQFCHIFLKDQWDMYYGENNECIISTWFDVVPETVEIVGDLFTKADILKAKIEELNFIIQVCYGDVELVKALKGKRDLYKEKLENQPKEMKTMGNNTYHFTGEKQEWINKQDPEFNASRFEGEQGIVLCYRGNIFSYITLYSAFLNEIDSWEEVKTEASQCSITGTQCEGCKGTNSEELIK